MAIAQNAAARYKQLDGLRQSFLRRCETYAFYTLPKLCPPNGYDQETVELNHDFQAVGAQAVNHLANKIMLALFAPGNPFFRADPDPQLLRQIAQLGMAEQELQQALAQGEKQAVAELDRMALRPKLYEAVKQLIVTGNALLCLEQDSARVIGIKHYVVRRSMSGQIVEIIIEDCVLFDELDPDVQAHVARYTHYQPDREVTLYRWINRLPTGEYAMTQWVDQYQLPKQFNGKWPEQHLPYRAMTWDLSDDAHYGTGLVEDYKGDFAGLSALTKAQVQGAILASEFRWLANPAGMTKPEDFQNSANGSVLPGNEGDLVLVQSGKSSDLQVTMAMAAEYIKRIGQGFLLSMAVTRDAERVTAEEIRMQANELETSLGGAYSRLAVDFQLPMAYWLLDRVGMSIRGKAVTPRIVTGMEALSRNGDLDDLKQWLNDAAAVADIANSLPVLNLGPLLTALALPRRVDVSAFLKSPEQMQAEQQQAVDQQNQQAATEAGIQAGADAAANSTKGK